MDEIYCSKCGEKNSINEDYCIECGSILRKLDKYESGDRITSFEDMFTQKHKEQLNETPLTNEIYELILDNIYETGKKSLKNKGSTALEKVADGKATKIIVPSELQNMASLLASAKEIMKSDN